MAHRRYVVFAVFSILAAGAGCAGKPDSNPEISAVRQRQFNPGFFVASQSGVEQYAVAVLSDGTEYFAAKSTYSQSANRAITGFSGTCSQWQSHVCGSGYTNATYWKATWAHQTLSCVNRPSQIQAPQGAVSFLSTGTWDSAVSGNIFATTYVASNVEYWAMNHTIQSTDTTTVNIRSTGYSSFTAFLNGICQSNPPTDWYSAYYQTASNFCNTSICP